MATPTRYTSQKQQERVSRHQFCERLDEFGWVASRPDEDLGEDFIVHIYFEGRATGVTFHAQLKSVTNLEERRQGDDLVYDEVKVKDLKHWEDFSLPVVLVVWDVEQREGRWALVDDVIADLDERRPQWRENKSKTRVRIPWGNGTDEVGLNRLQRSINQKLFPLLLYKEHFKNVTVDMDKVEESLRSTFRAHTDKSVKLSSTTALEIYTAYLDITTAQNEQFFLPPVEFVVVETTDKSLQFSNAHKDSPLNIIVTVQNENSKGETYLSIRLNHVGRTSRETYDTKQFLSAMANGGTLNFRPLYGKASILDKTISFNHLEKSFDRKFLQYFDKIVIIQNALGQLIRVPEGDLTIDNIRAIDKLSQIVERGIATIRQAKATGDFDKKALKIMLDVLRQDKSIHLTISSPESFVELFGQEIPTGRMARHITGRLALSTKNLEDAVKTLKPGETLSVQFQDPEIIEIFPDWYIREAERLSNLLVDNFDVEAIYLFGSLAWGDTWTKETDIDLAVRGLPGKQLFQAVTFLERQSDFPIDVVDLDGLSDYLRQRIQKEGKVLYEKEPVLALGG